MSPLYKKQARTTQKPNRRCLLENSYKINSSEELAEAVIRLMGRLLEAKRNRRWKIIIRAAILS